MPATPFTYFKELHYGSTPLLLPNAWDPPSAVLVQAAGARAIATSSAAFSWALGYADNEKIPRVELMSAIRRVARVVSVPLSVDLIDGYSSNPKEVADLVCEAYHCGASGINLADGSDTSDLHVRKIHAIRAALRGTGLFINARTDVYLANLASGEAAIEMTMQRLRAYQAAGADGVFVPGLADIDAIRRIAQGIDIPLNLMLCKHMPDIKQLHAAGARRFSAGPSLFQSGYDQVRTLSQGLLSQRDTQGWFAHELSYGEMNDMMKAAGLTSGCRSC